MRLWTRGPQTDKARFDPLRADFDALHFDAPRSAGEAAITPVHVTEGAYGEMEEWAAGHQDPLRKILRRQPLATCFVSMGAGALLGAVLLRL